MKALTALAFGLCCCHATFSAAREAASPAKDIVASGIHGTLVIVGGGKLPQDAVDHFIRAAGGANARLVVVPTASERADGDPEAFLRRWRKHELASLTLLHARSRDEANDPEFLAPLREATAVWFDGGRQTRLANAYVGTAFETELHHLLARSGVVGGTSAGAAIMSRLMIARGNPRAELGEGFDLLPDAVIDQHYRQRDRQPRLRAVLEQHPGRFGVGIDEGTAVVVVGRRLLVVGDSVVTLHLASSARRTAREIVLHPGEEADLTALRRAARNRAAADFPPDRPQPTVVAKGSLVIVGGGRLSRAVVERFMELAGGREAPIVVIPTAGEDPLPSDEEMSRIFRRAGAVDVSVAHGRERDEVERPELLHALRRAKGVWFGGGRQWRLVDAYQGTAVEELLHDVLRRGGVIGGSSAGASIQAEYLVRGNPLGNAEMMAEGYERGFAFLPGTAIDQHFAQRDRFADLESVVRTFPQLVGIGIDEATTLVVQGSMAEALGEHDVHFYHAISENGEVALRHAIVASGERYNLVERRKAD